MFVGYFLKNNFFLRLHYVGYVWSPKWVAETVENSSYFGKYTVRAPTQRSLWNIVIKNVRIQVLRSLYDKLTTLQCAVTYWWKKFESSHF